MFLPFKTLTTRQRCVHTVYRHILRLLRVSAAVSHVSGARDGVIRGDRSAAYAVLCVALMAGIKYLDDHTPERNPMKAAGDKLVRALLMYRILCTRG